MVGNRRHQKTKADAFCASASSVLYSVLLDSAKLKLLSFPAVEAVPSVKASVFPVYQCQVV